MRGKPFFVTKEWFPPLPLPRKSQRNRHIFSAKRIPAGTFGTRIGSHGQGGIPAADRMLCIRGNEKNAGEESPLSLTAFFCFRIARGKISIVS